VILVPGVAQVVIEGNFHSVVGTKAVGSSGDYSDFVVEALNGTIGDFSFGPKTNLRSAAHGRAASGLPFSSFQTATHGP